MEGLSLESVRAQSYLFKTQGELRNLGAIRAFFVADITLVVVGLVLTGAIRRGGAFHWEVGLPILAVILALGFLMAVILFVVTRQTLYFTVLSESLQISSPLLKMNISLRDILDCEYTPFISTEGFFELETKKGTYRWKVQQPQQLAHAIKKAKEAQRFKLAA